MGPKFVVLALFFLVLMGSQAAGPTSAARPAVHKSESKSTPPEPVTPLLGICDVTGATDVLGDLSDADAGKKRIQIALLQGRILECSHKIAALTAAAASATPYWASNMTLPAALPAPSEACVHPAPATTDSNRFALFEILERCSAYVTTVTGSATPAPAETPLPSIASRPTFYVFATGAVDPTTATVLIRSLVARLTSAERRATQSRSARPDPDALAAVLVASRADWTATESFTAQCQLDPNTRGALVIRTSMPQTYRNNYLLLVANFTQLSATVDVLGCASDDHNVNAAPLSLYSQEALSGKAHQDTVTLGIFSSIAAFLASDKSKTTVTTGNGSTTVVKSDSTAPAFSGNVLGYFEGESLDVPAQNASVQMNVAAKRLTDDAMTGLHRMCRRPEVLTLAAQGDPSAVPPSPPEHRTLAYKAAYEYVGDCALFGNFETPH
jgi:hypothetical protein